MAAALVITSPTRSPTPPPPSLVILVGLPGSGKSTFCQKLNPSVWTVINQDTLKSRKACERAASVALSQGNRVVIDRTNASPTQRSTWVELNRALWPRERFEKPVVWCIEFVVPKAVCISRCEGRKNHATVAPKDAAKIVGCVSKEMRPPNAGYEGFARVVHVHEFDGSHSTETIDVIRVLNDASYVEEPQVRLTCASENFSNKGELCENCGNLPFADQKEEEAAAKFALIGDQHLSSRGAADRDVTNSSPH